MVGSDFVCRKVCCSKKVLVLNPYPQTPFQKLYMFFDRLPLPADVVGSGFMFCFILLLSVFQHLGWCDFVQLSYKKRACEKIYQHNGYKQSGYKYHAKLRFIPQATLGINEGYILSITSFDSGKQIIADIAIVIALPSRYSFFTSFLL